MNTNDQKVMQNDASVLLRNKLTGFVLPVIATVISIAVVILVVIPQVKSYLDDRLLIEQTANKAVAVERKVQDLAQVNESQIDQKLKIAFTVLPEQPKVPEAVFAITDTATQSGVILEDISFSTTAKGSANSFTLRGNVIGPLKAIQTFINGLHSSPRVLSIESVEASFNTDNVASVEIPVTIYYKTASSKPLNPEQPLPKLNADDEKVLSEIAAGVESFNSKLSSLDQGPSVQIGKTNPFE